MMQTTAGKVLSGILSQGSTFIVFLAVLGLHPSILPAQSEAPPASLPMASSPPLHYTSIKQSTLSLEEIGDLHMARKRYQAAIEAYNRVPAKSPTVWNKIGMANQQLSSLTEAKKSYEASLRLNPKNPDVLNNLATIYFALKDYGTAERLYRKALKFNPKSAMIYKNLGTDLLAESKYKKGWEYYQTALTIDPEVFERPNQFRVEEPTSVEKRGAMNYFLAKCYTRAGNKDLAIEYLRRAIDQRFTDRKKILAESEFASLRELPAFQQLLSEQRIQ